MTDNTFSRHSAAVDSVQLELNLLRDLIRAFSRTGNNHVAEELKLFLFKVEGHLSILRKCSGEFISESLRSAELLNKIMMESVVTGIQIGKESKGEDDERHGDAEHDAG